jgi:3-hydroxybutyryl-CoA dehydrogenase
MGPLTLLDLFAYSFYRARGLANIYDSIGLDTVLAIMRVLQEGTGDSKYRPAVLLERMVDAGFLGKKSGKGFYEYDEHGNVVG